MNSHLSKAENREGARALTRMGAQKSAKARSTLRGLSRWKCRVYLQSDATQCKSETRALLAATGIARNATARPHEPQDSSARQRSRGSDDTGGGAARRHTSSESTWAAPPRPPPRAHCGSVGGKRRHRARLAWRVTRPVRRPDNKRERSVSVKAGRSEHSATSRHNGTESDAEVGE